MVSHSMEEIASNVDRLIVMEKGTAVMNGAPGEVFSHAAELVAMGLNVPCMTQVLLQLQQLGVDVPASAYTVEQAADLLAPLLKGAVRHAERCDPRSVFSPAAPPSISSTRARSSCS